MTNKTCGECRHFCKGSDICVFHGIPHIRGIDDACVDFEKPTNGDVIRQMSNEELAELFDNSCKVCSRSVTECDVECVKGILAWLNAPADAPDTNVGTKESEGGDE